MRGESEQLDIFDVLELVEKEGLVPGTREPVRVEPDPAEPFVVRQGFEYVVLVHGERANPRPLWSCVEARAFIDGWLARA